MIGALNKSLTADTWTVISTTEYCTLYSIRATIPNISFRIKKASDDTEYWTVEPSDFGKNAQLTVSSPNNELTGNMFYLSAEKDPVDVQIFWLN